jgi:hypothetical protein
MAGIVFENHDSWMVKNWVCGRLLSSVLRQNEGDAEMGAVLRVAITHNLLHLPLVRKDHGEMADRIWSAIKRRCEDILLREDAEFSDLEAQGRAMFRDAVSGLLRHIEKSKPSN